MELIYLTGDLEDDCNIMTYYLGDLDIYTGTNRKKLCKKGGSMLYGTTWRGYLSTDSKTGKKIYRTKNPNGNNYLTQSKVKYPWLEDLFREFCYLHCCKFEFNQVMINKDFPIGWHYDKANVGLSWLVSFGNYEGGLTELQFEEDGQEIIQFPLDSFHSPVCFNGSLIKHRVMPFTGTRYALVFFKS